MCSNIVIIFIIFAFWRILPLSIRVKEESVRFYFWDCLDASVSSFGTDCKQWVSPQVRWGLKPSWINWKLSHAKAAASLLRTFHRPLPFYRSAPGLVTQKMCWCTFMQAFPIFQCACVNISRNSLRNAGERNDVPHPSHPLHPLSNPIHSPGFKVRLEMVWLE